MSAALPTAARDLHGLGCLRLGVHRLPGRQRRRHGRRPARLCDPAARALPLIAGLVAFVAGLVLAGTAVDDGRSWSPAAWCRASAAACSITAVYVVDRRGATPTPLRPQVFAAISSAWVVPSLVGPVVSGLLAAARELALGVPRAGAVRRWSAPRCCCPVLRALHAAAPTPRGRPARPAPHRARRSPSRPASPRSRRPASTRRRCSIVPARRGLARAGAGACARCCRRAPSASRPGVSAPVALRGLLAGAFFGVESMVPLSLTVQHHYSADRGRPAADRRRASTWAIGSWWQGRDATGDGTRAGHG